MFVRLSGEIIHELKRVDHHPYRGWSGGAMVVSELTVPGRHTYSIIVGQGPTALAVGAGGICLDIFLSSILSPYFWETARCRLKYCLIGPSIPNKQTTKSPLLGDKRDIIVIPCLSACMEDNPRAKLIGLCHVQSDEHGRSIFYHPHQCRPCNFWQGGIINV